MTQPGDPRPSQPIEPLSRLSKEDGHILINATRHYRHKTQMDRLHLKSHQQVFCTSMPFELGYEILAGGEAEARSGYARRLDVLNKELASIEHILGVLQAQFGDPLPSQDPNDFDVSQA